jgi:hypothetical protein
MSEIEQTLVPGTPAEWREFDNEDYDPNAEVDGDEDLLGVLLAERTPEEQFGIVIVADPVERVSDSLISRLARALVPTKVRRESRSEEKTGTKKTKKGKKD